MGKLDFNSLPDLNFEESEELLKLDFEETEEKADVLETPLLQKTLAERNFNPGNLRFVGQKGAVKGEKGFAKFPTHEAGYTALKKQIKLDGSRNLTLGEFISKYAPPNENDTKAYKKSVITQTGFNLDSLVNKLDTDVLAKAIVKQEGGAPITTKEKPERKLPTYIPYESLDPQIQTQIQDQDQIPQRTFMDTTKDIGIAALKGAINVPEAIVGLLDIPTFGRVGKYAEDVLGYDPNLAKKILDTYYSEPQKAAIKSVEDAEGFWGTLKAVVKSPSLAAQVTLESLPTMGAGGVVARGVGAVAKVTPWIAAAIGEGTIGAGLSAESIRQQTKDELLTGKQSLAAIASGVGTGAFNLVGGRLAKRFGFDDIDTLIAGGKSTVPKGVAKGIVNKSKDVGKRIIAGGVSEGIFEELPQSAQEQMWMNAALNRPLAEGVSEAASLGLIVGAATGAGVNVVSLFDKSETKKEKKEARKDEIKELEFEEEVVEKKKVTPKEPTKKEEVPKAKVVEVKELGKTQQKYIDKRIEKLGSLEAVKDEYKLDDKVSKYARTKAAKMFGGEASIEKLTPKIKSTPITPGYEIQGRGKDKEGKLIGWKKEWQAKRDAKVAAQKAGITPEEYSVREGETGWIFQRRKLTVPGEVKKAIPKHKPEDVIAAYKEAHPGVEVEYDKKTGEVIVEEKKEKPAKVPIDKPSRKVADEVFARVKPIEGPKAEEQERAIEKRVRELKSLAAVKREYNKADEVSRFAREKAAEIYGGYAEVVKPEIKSALKEKKFPLEGDSFLDARLVRAKKEKNTRLIERIKDVKENVKELKKFINSDKTFDRIYQFGNMNLYKKDVGGKTKNVDSYYIPAVRLFDDFGNEHISYDKGIHINALEKAFKDFNIDPKDFNYDSIIGSGGIGPDGHYYESGYLGDLPDNVKEFKDLTTGKPEVKEKFESTVIGKPGVKKGKVVPWKMKHYAKKAAEKQGENWEVKKVSDGFVIQERSKIDVEAEKKTKPEVPTLYTGLDPVFLVKQVNELLKSILYHGSRVSKMKGKLKPSERGDFGKGIYLTPDKKFAKTFTTLENFGVSPERLKKGLKGSVFGVITDLKESDIFIGDKTKLTQEMKTFWEKEGEDMRDIITHEDLMDNYGGRAFVGTSGPSETWDTFYDKFDYKGAFNGRQLVIRKSKDISLPIKTGGVKLYSGIDPTFLVKETKKIIETLNRLGKVHFTGPKQRYFVWQKKMKASLGGLWNKVKKHIRKVWKVVKLGAVSVVKDSVITVLPDVKAKVSTLIQSLNIRRGDIAKDFKLFGHSKNKKQVNVGKDANKRIIVDESDAERFAALSTKDYRITAFTPAEFMFDRYPQVRNLLDQARETDKVVQKEVDAISKDLRNIEKLFPNKSLREKVGIDWHYDNDSGTAAMQALKHKRPEELEYKELRDRLQPLFSNLIERVNTVRIKLGKKPIKIKEGYLTFYAVESFMSDFINLTEGKKSSNSLVLDDWGIIKARQSLGVKDSTAFAHVRREGLRKGVKLELDPLVIINRYVREALNHIHKSPLIAFTKEVIKSDLTDPVTGKKFNFGKENPVAAKEIASWINKYAGLSNLNIPRSLERVGQKVMNNLTAAQLLGNLRTAIVQSAALGPTSWKFGYTNTFLGTVDTLFRRDNVPYKESNVLPTASWDAAADYMSNTIGKTKLGKGAHITKETAAFLMKGVDYLAREVTFRTVYKTLKPLIKDGKLTKKEAIRIADAEVIRTQGSGSTTEISPIQRNVLGKMATLWQTHTINQMNFFTKDVLGIKGKKIPKVERYKRIFRTMFGVVMTTILYEKVLGIQSPFPALTQALLKSADDDDNTVQMMRKLLLELSEGVPFGGSVKFGSSILGPIADHAQDIVKAISGKGDFNQDLLTSAASGNVKARIKIVELIGKTVGIPGTTQFTKFVRGRLRGESIPRAAIGRIYDKSKKSKVRNNIRKIVRLKRRVIKRKIKQNTIRKIVK